MGKKPTPMVPAVMQAAVLEAALKRDARRDVVPALTPRQLMFLCGVMELSSKGSDEAYGLKIGEWFAEQLERPINPGQMYAIAGELVKDGYLDERSLPNPSGRGRPIIVYKLSPLGATAFNSVGAVLAAGYKPPD